MCHFRVIYIRVFFRVINYMDPTATAIFQNHTIPILANIASSSVEMLNSTGTTAFENLIRVYRFLMP